MINSCATWTEALFSDLPQCIKEPQNSIYWVNFLNKKFESWDCFIPKITCYVLPVGALAVYSLLRNVFFTAWKCVVWEYHGLALRRVSCEKVSNLKYVTILQYKFAVECHNACWDIESPLLDKNSQLRLFLHNCNFISYIYHYYLTTSVNNF